LTPETATWIAQQSELSDITANRQATIRIKSKGEGEGDDDGETTTTTKGGRSTSRNRSIKYVCPKCGAIIRATKLVNVVCGDCNVHYDVEGSARKGLAHAIGEHTGTYPAYRAAPTFAYTIGEYSLDRRNVLTGPYNAQLLGLLAQDGYQTK